MTVKVGEHCCRDSTLKIQSPFPPAVAVELKITWVVSAFRTAVMISVLKNLRMFSFFKVRILEKGERGKSIYKSF